MTIKLVALDLDDTLLTSSLEISPECQEVLQAVQDRGVMITIATGRMFGSAKPYAVGMSTDVPLITYQGALVKKAVSGEVIYYRPVPCEQALQVIEIARDLGCHYQAYFDDRLYMEKLTQEGQDYATLVGSDPVFEPGLYNLIKEKEPTKVIIIKYDLDYLINLENDLKERFAGRLHITRSKPFFLEALNLEATKGRALEKVSEHFGFHRQEVLAIGDSYNDIEMLDWAGIGVAVANAHPEVKAHADYITLSNDDHGVAEALRHFILKD
ncbi:MAG: Cof-type HAD-IIB family hydrolase [Acidobacteriota bacterium]